MWPALFTNLGSSHHVQAILLVIPTHFGGSARNIPTFGRASCPWQRPQRHNRCGCPLRPRRLLGHQEVPRIQRGPPGAQRSEGLAREVTWRMKLLILITYCSYIININH